MKTALVFNIFFIIHAVALPQTTNTISLRAEAQPFQKASNSERKLLLGASIHGNSSKNITFFPSGKLSMYRSNSKMHLSNWSTEAHFQSMNLQGISETSQLLLCRQVCRTCKLESKLIVERLSYQESLTHTSSSIYSNKLRIFFMQSILKNLLFFSRPINISSLIFITFIIGCKDTTFCRQNPQISKKTHFWGI